ncbi:MAG: carbohydrate ABC transporter permease [Micromonosporaceae bacterium]
MDRPLPAPLRHRVTRLVGVIVVAAVFLAPLALLVSGSLRTPGLPPPGGLELLPERARLDNYPTAVHLVPFGRQLLNSLTIIAIAVPVTVLVASWSGYAIVTAGRRLRWLLIGVSVGVLMVPASALWVPRVVLLESLGMTGHPAAVALPSLMATSPFYVLLMALAYARVPRSLYEAAAVEGLTPLQTWWRVAWPLGRPAAFAVGVLAYVFYWSDFVGPLLLLPSERDWPLALGLRALAELEPAVFPLFLAGAVLATMPAALAFALAQRSLFRTTLGE